MEEPVCSLRGGGEERPLAAGRHGAGLGTPLALASLLETVSRSFWINDDDGACRRQCTRSQGQERRRSLQRSEEPLFTAVAAQGHTGCQRGDIWNAF